jgi:hypothetical protein
VTSIVGLAMLMLFWPLISRGLSLGRRSRAAARPAE